MKIVAITQSISKIRVEMKTTDNRVFYMLIGDGKFEFYSDMNDAQSLLGKPISRSVDDIFEWISEYGDNKKFKDRKGVQPKPLPKSSQP